jgi:hypothetical protein
MTDGFLTTKNIGDRLGFPMPAKFIIKSLGVPAEKKVIRAYYWTPAQFTTICEKIEQRAMTARIKLKSEIVTALEAAAVKALDDDEL